MKSNLLIAIRQKVYSLPILLILLICTAACGTLEVDLESSAEDPTRQIDNSGPSPTFNAPPYDREVGVRFGDMIELVGYSIKPSDSTEIATATLVWNVLSEIQPNLVVLIMGSDG